MKREAALDPDRPTVLITGSNRGIGFGLVQQYAADGWNVIATTRNPTAATELQNFSAESKFVHIEALDVLDETELGLLSKKYAHVPIDVLINNAAFHGGAPKDHLLGTYSYSTFERYMAVNVFGPLKVAEAFLDSVAQSEQKKIVTITTGLAILSSPPPIRGFTFQSISKAAVNRAMRTLQIELRDARIIVALISPGRVDTDGLAEAGAAVAAGRNGAPPPSMPPPLSIENGAAAMTEVIASLDETYDGSHLDLHGNVIPW